MRRDDVSQLIGMVCATKGMVRSISYAAYAREGYGDVTELIAGDLEKAYTGLETARDNLCEYLDTEAEE